MTRHGVSISTEQAVLASVEAKVAQLTARLGELEARLAAQATVPKANVSNAADSWAEIAARAYARLSAKQNHQ